MDSALQWVVADEAGDLQKGDDSSVAKMGGSLTNRENLFITTTVGTTKTKSQIRHQVN